MKKKKIYIKKLGGGFHLEVSKNKKETICYLAHDDTEIKMKVDIDFSQVDPEDPIYFFEEAINDYINNIENYSNMMMCYNRMLDAVQYC